MSPSPEFIAESFKPSSGHAMLALLQFNFAFRQKTAQAGGASTITLDAEALPTANYTGKSITILTGTGAGQSRTINDYNGATKVVTVSDAWDVVPDSTSVYRITETLRYVANNEAVVSNGETFQPIWFDLQFPDSTEERLPDVRILFDNTDLELAQRIREHDATLDPPTVVLSAVTTIDLDFIEIGPQRLTVKTSGNRNAETLEVNCGVEDILNRSLLPVRYSAYWFPGIHYRPGQVQ